MYSLRVKFSARDGSTRRIKLPNKIYKISKEKLLKIILNEAVHKNVEKGIIFLVR